MKKILILSALICCYGCNDTGTNTIEPSEKLNVEQYFKNSTTKVFTIEVEGHLYLVYDGHNACGILHAEHCPCKNK
jgi:hypothetical protein